jgi:hypothetical protein
MAQRQKVGPISGTRAVSTPKATNIDIYAAPTKNNLGDLSNALNNLNPKLQAYGDKMKVDKDNADMAKLEVYAQTFRAETGAGVVDAVRAGELHPNLSTIVQSKLKERLGQLWVEDEITKSIKLMNADPEISGNADLRNAYYETTMAGILEQTKDQPFFSNAALVKGKNMLEAREHNYLEIELAETKKTFETGFSADLTTIILKPGSTPAEVAEQLVLADQMENDGGSMLTGRERKDLIVDNLISAAYALSVTDPDGAAALLGSMDANGNLVGSGLPKMLGDANLHGDAEIKDKLIKAQLALVTAKNARITANGKARTLKRADKANVVMNEFNEAVYNMSQDPNGPNGGNAYMNPNEWIRKNHPDVFTDPDFTSSDIYSKFLETADKRNNQPALDEIQSLSNLNIAEESIRGVALTNDISTLDPSNPIHAEIIELFPDGNIDLNASNISKIAQNLSLNPDEEKAFIKNATANIQAANQIKASHVENFERKYITNKIESKMEQLQLSLAEDISGVKDNALNIQGNITDLYDNYIWNEYINYHKENNGPPSPATMREIYSSASKLVTEELAEYEKFAKDYNANAGQGTVPNPVDNDLEQTARIGDFQGMEWSPEDIIAQFGDGTELTGGRYKVERIAKDEVNETDYTYTDGAGKTWRVVGAI